MRQEDYQLDLEDYNQNNNQKPPLGRNQKIAAAVLGVFAIMAFGMWLVQLKQSINEPFAYHPSENQSSATEQEQSAEDLKNKDTDKDGLSDYDELNVYKTSPYLDDSDSDGYPDKQEIDNNQDPNCPVGRDCTGAGIVDGDTSVVNNTAASGDQQQDLTNNLLQQFNAASSTNSSSALPQQPVASVNMQALTGGGNMDAATLRQLLLEHGMQKEMLDQISDQELLSSFNSMMQSGQ